MSCTKVGGFVVSYSPLEFILSIFLMCDKRINNAMQLAAGNLCVFSFCEWLSYCVLLKLTMLL